MNPTFPFPIGSWFGSCLSHSLIIVTSIKPQMKVFCFLKRESEFTPQCKSKNWKRQNPIESFSLLFRFHKNSRMCPPSAIFPKSFSLPSPHHPVWKFHAENSFSSIRHRPLGEASSKCRERNNHQEKQLHLGLSYLRAGPLWLVGLGMAEMFLDVPLYFSPRSGGTFASIHLCGVAWRVLIHPGQSCFKRVLEKLWCLPHSQHHPC